MPVKGSIQKILMQQSWMLIAERRLQRTFTPI